MSEMISHSPRSVQSIAVIGAGGNIGSHLVLFLAALGLRLVLVDRGFYENKNLRSQNIDAADIGKPKVTALANRLRRIVPGVAVWPIVSRVEDVPLGHLWADVLVTCLDSRAARQYCHQLAWRFAAVVVDTAVDATGLLARCEVYVPGADAPCLECPWDTRDYAALEQEYPCQAVGDGEPPPTNAPRALGAMAAGMAAIEIQKMVHGRWDEVPVGQQQMLDLRHHRQFVTAFRRRPDCRFDHQTWRVESVPIDPRRASLSELLRQAGIPRGEHLEMGVEGRPFVASLFCGACDAAGNDLHCLDGRIPAARQVCRRCGAAMVARGVDKRSRIRLCELPRRRWDASLGSFGLRPGDILSINAGGGERHLVLAPPHGVVQQQESTT